MPRWLLQLVILTVVLFAICWAALSRKGENVLSYCEPECSETVEHLPPPPPTTPTQPPEKPISIDGISTKALLAVLIAGLVGFAIGRLTAAPSAADVARVINAATTARVTEATLHGVAVAPGLLGALQTAAITAVNGLLPPSRSAGWIAAGLAVILFFVLLGLPGSF
jgi:hypothetical protein